MNEIKIQKDILTALSKDKFTYWAETLNSICASDNDKQLFIFPKDRFYLNLPEQGKTNSLIKLLNFDGKQAHPVKVEMIHEKEALILECENEQIYLHKKYVDRYIEKGSNLTYEVSGKKNPVKIYDNAEMVGLIMPVVTEV